MRGLISERALQVDGPITRGLFMATVYGTCYTAGY